MSLIASWCLEKLEDFTGVVGVAAIPPLTWLFRDRSNHPRRGLWPLKASQAFSPSFRRRGAGVPSFGTETSRRLKERSVKS
jgi:hypothetical protein